MNDTYKHLMPYLTSPKANILGLLSISKDLQHLLNSSIVVMAQTRNFHALKQY